MKGQLAGAGRGSTSANANETTVAMKHMTTTVQRRSTAPRNAAFQEA